VENHLGHHVFPSVTAVYTHNLNAKKTLPGAAASRGSDGVYAIVQDDGVGSARPGWASAQMSSLTMGQMFDVH